MNFSIFTAQERIIPRRNRAGLFEVSFANFLFFFKLAAAEIPQLEIDFACGGKHDTAKGGEEERKINVKY